MTEAHEEQEDTWPKEVIVLLEEPFVDERGVIQNLVDAPMRTAVLIESKKGAVRANHYHKSDWHYCYVLSGSIEYYHRPVGSGAEPECQLVRKGQVFFTPPMVEHAMKFPEDAVFLTLSRNPRDHESYESDLVRTRLI
ncbi:MAG: cupin domain-containing protein [bacterium]